MVQELSNFEKKPSSPLKTSPTNANFCFVYALNNQNTYHKIKTKKANFFTTFVPFIVCLLLFCFLNFKSLIINNVKR